MTRKRLLLLILCTWAVVGLLALVLQCATGGSNPLLGEPSAYPRLSYGLSMASAMFTILACYYLVRRQQSGGIFQRLLLLLVPAVLTVLDYYFFFDSGMIACLPVLAVVSAMMFIKKES